MDGSINTNNNFTEKYKFQNEQEKLIHNDKYTQNDLQKIVEMNKHLITVKNQIIQQLENDINNIRNEKILMKNELKVLNEK
jgi:hypothetical protein